MQRHRTLPELCCLAVVFSGGIAAAASLSPVDQQFVKTAATMHMTQANEGQMAENQASNGQVKGLAQTVVQDNTDCYNQLSHVAGQAGASVPTGINTAHIPTVHQLAALKGNRFDRQYVASEISSERRALDLYRREAKDGKDAGLKSYAAKMVPVVEKDLKQAEACAKIG